jgi:hypothetical protein
MAVNKEARSKAFAQSLGNPLQRRKARRGASVRATPEQQRQAMKDAAYGIASLAPVSGEIISAKEGIQDFQEGNYGMAALGAVGAIPFAGIPFRAAKGMLKGAAKSAGSLANKTAQNMPTHIDKFYTNPVMAAKGFGQEFTKAVPSAIKESIDPAARAKRRVMGLSDKKIDDWVTPKTGKDAELTAISIQRQLPDTQDTLLEKSVVHLNYLDSRIPREDAGRLSNAIGDGYRAKGSVPENIVQRATRHLTEGAHVTKPNAKYEYQIKDPSAGGDVGYIEGVGSASTAAPILRALHGKATDSYLTAVNKIRKGQKVDSLAGKDMVEFMQISSTLDGKNLDAIKRAVKAQKPDLENIQDSYVIDSVLKGRLKASAGKESKGTQAVIHDVFNQMVDKGSIKMARVSDEAGNAVGANKLADIKDPDGFLVTQQSFLSQQKELGGMNAFVAVDPNNQKMYTMLSDGHDIFGQVPVGGHHLITATPLIESSLKTGSKYNNKQIRTAKTQRNVNRAIKATEETTGIKKLKSESVNAYTKRAFKESKPKVSSQDIAGAQAAKTKLKATAGAGLLTGAATTRALTDDE